MNDLRFAIRQLLKHPGFTAVAVLTLALGVGASTALFTIFSSLLFRPVPVKDPASVVRLHVTDREGSFLGHLSYPDYVDVCDQNTSLAALAASAPAQSFFWEAGFGPDAAPQRIRGTLVSENYFSVLGGGFSAGRGFESRGADPVVVLSHGFWQRRMNGVPAVGQTVRLNGLAFTVVGVTAPDFKAVRFDRMPDIWIPLAMQPQLRPGENWLSQRDRFWLQVDGRLRPGTPLASAQDELRVLAARLAESFRGGKELPMIVTPASVLDPADRRELKPLATTAMVAVGLITLTAGANLANLLLFRAVSRRKEIAVRLSLGASRARLMRQLFTENALLGVLGGVLGLLIAHWLADLVVVLTAGTEGRAALSLSLDWRVLGYAAAIAGLVVFGFGFAPALQTAQHDVAGALKEQAGGLARGVMRSRLRGALIGAQVALSLVLLVSSALLIRTLQRGLTLDTGLDIKRTVTISLDLEQHGYEESRAVELKRALTERLSALPNVRGIAQVSAVPLSGVRNATDYQVEARTEVLAENEVSANFLEVLGADVSRGRMFTADEVRIRQPVAVMTEATARRLWPGEDPLGKRLRRGQSGPSLEIIGTVRDSPNQALYEDEADVFLPMRLDQQRDLSLLLRTTDGSKALLGTIIREVRALDNSLWPEAAFLADKTPQRLRGEITLSWLASGLGLLALALAMTGLYGVLSWLVAQRTRELGLRMALGAPRGRLIQLVLKQGILLVGAGMTVGLLASVAASRALKGMIYDLSPLDPFALFGATLSLLLAALLACWLPARRAARVDPMVALRGE